MLVETNSAAGYGPTVLPQGTQYWAILSQYELYSERFAQALIWVPVVLLLGVIAMQISFITVAWVIAGTIATLVLGWWTMSTFAKAELTGSLYQQYVQTVRGLIVGTIETYAILLALVPLLAMFVFSTEF